VGEAPTAQTQTVTRRRDTTPLMRRDPEGLARHFAASGYFKDATEMSQAIVKIVAGEEVGLGPMASMQGIRIIDGKPSHSANVLATLIKRSEKYDYKVKRSDNEVCELEFFENDEPAGISKFTYERAQKMQVKEYGQWKALAETRRWQNSPEDMLFARCISRGHRKFAPDVTAGTPAYTPEELGAEVDDEGEVVYPEVEVVTDAQVVEETPPADQPPHVAPLKWLINLASPSLQELGINTLDGVNAILSSLDLGSKMIDLGKLDEGLGALTEDEAKDLAKELQACIIHQVEEFNAAIQDRSQHLGKGGAEGNWHDGFNVLLGSIGLDAIPPSADFAQALAAFTPEQRQAIEEELEKLELNAETTEAANASA
jgi:hypothetical protein